MIILNLYVNNVTYNVNIAKIQRINVKYVKQDHTGPYKYPIVDVKKDITR